VFGGESAGHFTQLFAFVFQPQLKHDQQVNTGRAGRRLLKDETINFDG